MAIEEVTGLVDINVGDKVFKNTDTQFMGKVRLKRRPSVDGGEAFLLSVSQVDTAGKAKMKSGVTDRDAALAKIASGEARSSDYFIIGEATTITMMMQTVDSSPTSDLSSEINIRMEETEIFAAKQIEISDIYAQWGI